MFNSLCFFDLAALSLSLSLSFSYHCQLVELAVVILYLNLSHILIHILSKILKEWNQRRLSKALLFSIKELVLFYFFFFCIVDSELTLSEVAPGVWNPIYVNQGLETFTNISWNVLAFACITLLNRVFMVVIQGQTLRKCLVLPKLAHLISFSNSKWDSGIEVWFYEFELLAREAIKGVWIKILGELLLEGMAFIILFKFILSVLIWVHETDRALFSCPPNLPIHS